MYNNVIMPPDLRDSMGYPVGEKIRANRTHINAMIDAIESIADFKDKYINLVCRGSSGAIIAGIVSVMIKNDNRIVHIKKDGESSHSDDASIKGAIKRDTINIIIDDFMCSGKTINAIYEKLQNMTGDDKLVVDCLCISGVYFEVDVKFDVNHLICGRIG